MRHLPQLMELLKEMEGFNQQRIRATDNLKGQIKAMQIALNKRNREP